MMDLNAIFSEFMATIIILVTKPCSLCKLACMFCVKTTFIIIHMWMELVRGAIGFHLNLFWRAMIWTANLISLPVRVLTALQRERLLEERLNEMQFELETLVWDRKELEDNLRAAIKEHRIMESLLAELEEEHDKAIAKIEMLQGELHDLKKENLRVREIQGKGHADKGSGRNTGIADNYGIPDEFQSLKTSYDGNGLIFQDLMMKSDVWEEKSKSYTGFSNFLKAGPKSSGSIYPFTPSIVPKNLEMSEVPDYIRGVALSQSIFSAMLSLLVGMIIWEAEDPCMPLVGALFIVVGMSLKSVVQFFWTIKNKPASDAVALLSLNWFVLGTLTYPTLPRVARVLSPLALRIVDRTVSSLGITFH